MRIDEYFGAILEPKDLKIGDKVIVDIERDVHIKGMKNTPIHISIARDLTVTKIGRKYIGVSHLNNGKVYMVDPFIIKKYK